MPLPQSRPRKARRSHPSAKQSRAGGGGHLLAAFSVRRAWAAFVVGVRVHAPREDGKVMLETAAVGRDPRESPRVCNPGASILSRRGSRAHELLCTFEYGFIYKLFSAYRTFRSLPSRSPYASLIPYPFSVFAPALCGRFQIIFDHFLPRWRPAPPLWPLLFSYFRLRFP